MAEFVIETNYATKSEIWRRRIVGQNSSLLDSSISTSMRRVNRRMTSLRLILRRITRQTESIYRGIIRLQYKFSHFELVLLMPVNIVFFKKFGTYLRTCLA